MWRANRRPLVRRPARWTGGPRRGMRARAPPQSAHPRTLGDARHGPAAPGGFARPGRSPRRSFYLVASAVEAFAAICRTAAPLTRDFIRIGMASYVMDTTRMKRELRPRLPYPTLTEGLALME